MATITSPADGADIKAAIVLDVFDHIYFHDTELPIAWGVVQARASAPAAIHVESKAQDVLRRAPEATSDSILRRSRVF